MPNIAKVFARKLGHQGLLYSVSTDLRLEIFGLMENERIELSSPDCQPGVLPIELIPRKHSANLYTSLLGKPARVNFTNKHIVIHARVLNDC